MVDLAVWDLLLWRCRMVFRNTLLACQYFESIMYLKLIQDCILDFFTWKGAEIRHSAYRELQVRFIFVLKQWLEDRCLFFHSIFHLLVSSCGHFLGYIYQIESFPSTYPSSRWSYSCCEQLQLRHPVCCALPRLIGTRAIHADTRSAKVSYLFPPEPSTLFARSSWFCMLSLGQLYVQPTVAHAGPVPRRPSVPADEMALAPAYSSWTRRGLPQKRSALLSS